jgi:hypothetical protein
LSHIPREGCPPTLRSSEGHRTYIRRASDVHPEGIGRTSGGHRTYIRRASDVHREGIGCSSGGHRMFIRRASDVHPEGIGCSSGGGTGVGKPTRRTAVESLHPKQRAQRPAST